MQLYIGPTVASAKTATNAHSAAQWPSQWCASSPRLKNGCDFPEESAASSCSSPRATQPILNGRSAFRES